MQGNRRFREGTQAPRELVRRRAELANHQSPEVIVLACSDSRVCPSLIFDKNLGDLFVIRTAGNVADRVALGSLEYAAEYLQSSVLVVLGHEHCGGVAAASGKRLPSSNLESIVDKIRPALESVKDRAAGEELLRLAERANVHQSASDILRNSALLQQKVSDGKLALIKAIYQLSTGQVIRLPD
jgi:carbonic anhydrase